MPSARASRRSIRSAHLLIKWISDARMLREAWDFLAAKGDTAPGPNGHRYDDFDDNEIWELLRTISKAIRNDTYRVGAERIVNIPKDRSDRSRGTRPITLIDIEDRVVQRAVVEVLQRLLDPLFGPTSSASELGHGRLHALALAERKRWPEAVRFSDRRHPRCLHPRCPNPPFAGRARHAHPVRELLQLLGRMLGTGKKHGIRQGGPLSPLLLNLTCTMSWTEPWQKSWATVPMIRVADDMLLLCRSRNEAVRARGGLEALLTPANMPLKARLRRMRSTTCERAGR